MKICPTCQQGNSDDAILCKDCGQYLGRVGIQDREALLKAQAKQRERQHKRRRGLTVGGICLCGALNVLFLMIAAHRGIFLFPMVLLALTPALGYASIFHADAMFRLNYFMDIDNLSDAQPSDWYYMKSVFGGVVLSVMGPIVLGIVAFYP